MSKIRIYVENSFSSLPRTKEVVEMKLHIIESMEEAYENLIREGKNENEAFGLVIAEFGSIEEIRRELGIPEGSEFVPPSYPAVPEDFRIRYEQFNRIFAVAVTVGVLCCILAIIFQQVFEAIFGDGYLSTIAFFIMIAIGVGIFVFFGMQKNHLDEQMEAYTRSSATFVNSPKNSPQNDLVGRLIGAIMLTATAVYLILGFLSQLWHPGWVVFPIGGILCGILSVILGDR